MSYIIILFGTATMVAGIMILINPDFIFGLMRRNLDSLILHILAVIIRIIIGLALIVYAAESKYPTAINILGWISIAAAFILGIMGRENFKKLMSWALNLKPSVGRFGGIFAALFGGFLVYAVL